MPHQLSESQEKFRVDASRELLSMLEMYGEHDFNEITIGDES